MKDASPNILDHLKTDCCTAFAKAWLRWKRENTIPSRDEIELRDIAKWLPYLSVLEVRSQEEQIFRLVGSAINQARGRELTGSSLKELSKPEDWPKRSQINWEMVQVPCGITFEALFEYSFGQPTVSEYLCLPVRPLKEGDGIQLFTIREPLEDVSLRTPILEAKYNPVGDQNRFVDIGCGTPSKDFLTDKLEPLQLLGD